jgi:vanillate monooxygenase ferredoxin subunit
MTEVEKLLRVRIRESQIEADQIRSFALVGVGCDLPVAPAGSHIDVHIAPDVVRQYSICNGPCEGGAYQIAVKREPQSRGGSAALFESKQVGDELLISRPRNRFSIKTDAKSHVLFAGGIGVTPLLSMLKQLTAAKERCRLYYFVRSKECAAFVGQLEGAAYRDSVSIVVGASAAQSEDEIDRAIRREDREAHIYACGPAAFMNAVERMLVASGRSLENYSSEHFNRREANSGEKETASFDVEFAASRRVLAVGKDQTIVDSMRAAGMQPRVSCEIGICGTCALRVIKGEIDHKDDYLTDEEKRSGSVILPCVSRARGSKLVVDG